MSQKDVTITYEMLYELLRRERQREELQELDQEFYGQVISYLQEKEGILQKAAEKNDLFSRAEQDKIQLQLQNIRRIITQLYERRERKIIEMSLNKSRTNMDIIDTANLLHEEKEMFGSLVSCLDQYREGVLNKTLMMQSPIVKQKEEPVQVITEEKSDTMSVRFTKDVPSFVGKELEVYGPFKQDDTAKLPAELAKLIIEQGKAINEDAKTLV